MCFILQIFVMNRFEIRQKNLAKLVRQYGSRQALANALCVAPSEIGNYFGNSNREITDKKAIEYEAKLNLPAGYLDQNDENQNTSASIISNFDNDVANSYAVDTKILAENGWKSENLRVMRVTDEGMEPLIADNALILIDISQTEPESGKIYAVQFEDDILIRRVIKIAGSNQYIAKPATFAFIEQNFTKETAKVLGRVVYRMGELL